MTPGLDRSPFAPTADRAIRPGRISRAWRFGAVGFAALALCLFLPTAVSVGQSGPAPVSAVDECDRPFQPVIDAAPAGATVTLPACIHRETLTIARPLTLVGAPGAEIRGSDVWTAWRATGVAWTSGPAVPRFEAHGECRPGTERCHWPEQVFRDDAPLLQVAASPAPGQFALDEGRHVVLGDDPAGHRIEVTTRTRWIVPLVDGITVTGLTMRHAANDAQSGAIDDDGHDLMVRDSTLSDAHGAVVWMSGRGEITGNEIARGGQMGVGKGGSLVEGNDIHDNNTEDFDPGWEAGGMKSVASGVVVRGNDIHDNDGPGVWFDIQSSDITIADNRIHGNRRAGIVIEISSRVRVSGNVVWRNGADEPGWLSGAGILVNTSGDVVIDGNVVAWNADGIGIESQDRPDRPADADHGIEVRANTIVMDDGVDTTIALGWAADWASPLFLAASANHGIDNRFGYLRGEGSTERFAWNGPSASLAAFAATPGGAGSRYLDRDAIETVLGDARVPLRSGAAIPAQAVVDYQVLILAIVGVELAVLIVAAFIRRTRRDTWVARSVRLASPLLIVGYAAIAIGTRSVDLIPDPIEPLLVVLVPAAGAIAIAIVASGWVPTRRPTTPHIDNRPADPADRR